jgi:hypothetical protein
MGIGLGYIKEFRMPTELISRIHVAARSLSNPERETWDSGRAGLNLKETQSSKPQGDRCVCCTLADTGYGTSVVSKDDEPAGGDVAAPSTSGSDRFLHHPHGKDACLDQTKKFNLTLGKLSRAEHLSRGPEKVSRPSTSRINHDHGSSLSVAVTINKDLNSLLDRESSSWHIGKGSLKEFICGWSVLE